MNKTSYDVIVKSVIAGAPALAKEVIDDLNDSLERLDKFEKSVDKVTKKKEN